MGLDRGDTTLPPSERVSFLLECGAGNPCKAGEPGRSLDYVSRSAGDAENLEQAKALVVDASTGGPGRVISGEVQRTGCVEAVGHFYEDSKDVDTV